MPNLNEEIAAMAFSTTSAMPGDSSRNDDSHKYPHSMNTAEKPQKPRRSRSRLVQEIRISVSITEYKQQYVAVLKQSVQFL